MNALQGGRERSRGLPEGRAGFLCREQRLPAAGRGAGAVELRALGRS